MADVSQISLLGLDRAELAALVDSWGEPAYRAKQLREAVYRQRVESVEEVSTLSRELRGKLAEKGISIGLPRIEKRFVSQDGTVRYLIAFADGQSVETVWMPEGDGGEAGDGSEAGEWRSVSRKASRLGSGVKPFQQCDPVTPLKRAPPKSKVRIKAVPRFVFPAKLAAPWIASSV